MRAGVRWPRAWRLWQLSWLLCALASTALAQPSPSSEPPETGSPGGRRAPAPYHRRAGPGGPPHGAPLERMLEQHADRLGLDATITEQIRAIAEESSRRSRAHREELRTLNEELRALLSEESPDEEAVMHQVELIGQAETADRQQRLHDVLRVRALLTPEQRQELVRIHRERKQTRDRRPRGAPAPAEP